MKSLFKSVMKALLLCVITAAVLVFIFAFVASLSDDSTANLKLYAMITLYASAFAGALRAALSAEGSRLASVLCFALLLSALCFMLSLFLGIKEPGGIAVSYLGIAAVSLLAAFLANRKRPTAPKNLKKFKKAIKKMGA